MNGKVKKNRGISLSTQILIGLTLGLFVGLFLGDKASPLAIVGRAYIGLIQMSILPYMVVSLDEKLIIRLGVVGEKRANDIKRTLPNTDIVVLETYHEFFLNNPKGVGGLVISAEAGSAWTIIYPSYSVTVPEPHIKAHAGLAMPLGNSDFADLVDDWLELKKTSGFINKLYDKWILGKSSKRLKPRWSIIRDVLHWVEEHEGEENR